MSKTFEEIKTYCNKLLIRQLSFQETASIHFDRTTSISNNFTNVYHCKKLDDHCSSAHCPLLGIIMKGIEGSLNDWIN